MAKAKIFLIILFALILRLFFLNNQQQDNYLGYARGEINFTDSRLFPGYPLLLSVFPNGIVLNLILSALSILVFYLITNNFILTFLFSFFPPIWVYQGAKIATEPLTVFFLLFSLLLWQKQKEFFSGFICGLAVTVRLISICFGAAVFFVKPSLKFIIGFTLGSSLLFIYNYYTFNNLFIQFEVYPQIGGAGGSSIGLVQIFKDIFRAIDWGQYRILFSGLFYLLISFIALVRLKKINKLYFYWLLFSLIFIFSLSPAPLLEEYSRFLVPVVPVIIIGLFYFPITGKLIKTNPPPLESDGKDFTDRDYSNMDSERYQYLANKLLSLAPSHYPLTPRLLDVGCGAGYFSNEAKIRGFNVTGIDISKKATDYAAKYFKIYTVCTDLQRFKTKQKFNVILLNHVLEHITDLKPFLLKVKSLLTKDGIVLIVSPNYRSLMRIIFGKRWYGLQPDQHVWQFTPNSLSDYLISQNFKINKIISSSLDYDPPDKIKNIIFRIVTKLAERLNLGDQLIILCSN